MLRIDKQLERNQNIRALQKRFNDLFWAFKPEDYENPATNKSIFEALSNIHKGLSEALNGR